VRIRPFVVADYPAVDSLQRAKGAVMGQTAEHLEF
jgi:hypothetical protein